MAERKGIKISEISNHYDELELEMLKEFYSFVNQHKNVKWVHWNMRDTNYGFRAIEHRYRVLGDKPIEIPEGQLYDVARTLIDIYGPRYIEHPRLERLMEKNSISKKDFLAGKEEAEVFLKSEYVKLHQSTLRKVDIIATITERAWKQDLVTNAKWLASYGTGVAAFIEAVTDHWLYKFLGFLGIVASLIGLIALKK